MLQKSLYCGFLLLFVVSTALSQTIINRPGIGDCKLVFEDNFDSTALNTNVWDYRTDVRFWSKQVPENVSVADGYLYLNVKQQNIGTTQYTGAGVITKKGYKYGYYESRFKIPPGKGWHTSFWTMYRTPSTGIPYSKLYQEIDICENDSRYQTSYTTNLHNYSPVHTSYGGKGVSTPNLSNDFHVWACEFTPQEVKFYFEGQLVRTLDATKQTHGDASIWLTTIAAPLGDTDTVDVAKLPSAAVFDYVRYYEQLNPILPDTAAINDSLRTTPNAENPQIIIDNTDSGCTFSTAWSISNGITGFYGTNYAYYPSNSSTVWAKWTPVIPEDGNYRIFMRWAAYSNRPPLAPVEIKHMEGASTVKVNQTLDGGKWNFLGSYQLNAGSDNYAKITCSGGINTVADAVLFEKIPEETAVFSLKQQDLKLKFTPVNNNKIQASFELPTNAVASLRIYNIYGSLVSEVFANQRMDSGKHNFNIDATKFAQGMYIATFIVDNQLISVKVRI